MFLKDLERLKQQATDAQKNKTDIQIVVNMGSCSMAKNAGDTYDAIADEIKKRGLEQVEIIKTGCFGMCESEPLIEIIKKGQPKVTYGKITPDKARHIVASHIVNDQVVGELVLSVDE